MGKPITKDEANKLVWNLGYFYGLEKLEKEYEISKEKLIQIRAGLYKHILIKVSEAKKEIARLQVNVLQMEAACRAGMNSRSPIPPGTPDRNQSALIAGLQPFDGWVISLLETDIALLYTVHNPETAGFRVNGLKDSFARLYQLRAPGIKPYDNYSNIFDMSIFVL